MQMSGAALMLQYFYFCPKCPKSEGLDILTQVRSKIHTHDQEICSNVKEGVQSTLAHLPKTQFRAR